MNIFRELLHDEHGFIISSELVVISTLLVVGLITGLQYIQASVVGEMNDVASAIGSLNQSYCYSGKQGCCSWGHGLNSWTSGSCFADTVDEPHVQVDFACLDAHVLGRDVALSNLQTPCDKPCDKPCGSPCCAPCGNPCHHPCDAPCGNPCGNPCGDPCGIPCGSPCDDPCSPAGRPARIYGSAAGGCGSRIERFGSLDCGPLPVLPPLRPCPVNDNPCPGCSGDAAASPECGPQLFPTLLSDCRPCSPTDLQIVW